MSDQIKTLAMFRRWRRAGGIDAEDKREYVDAHALGRVGFDGQGVGEVYPLLTAFYNCDLLPPVGAAAAGKDNRLTITGTGTVPTPTRADKGGINLATRTTSAAQNDEARVVGVTDSNFIAKIRAGSRLRFSCTVMLPTITTMLASFGLNENVSSSIPTATAGEGAMFAFDTEDQMGSGVTANWVLAHKVNGVDTFKDTGVAVVADVDYEFMIDIDKDLKANFYINGVNVGQGPALTSGDSVAALAGVQTEATSSIPRSFDLRHLRLSRLIG